MTSSRPLLPQHCRSAGRQAALISVILVFEIICAATWPALAQGNSAAGAAIFRTVCASCHTAVPGRNSIGPSLYGVFGRKAGQAPGYHYSPALLQSGITWTEEELLALLTSPGTKIPGTKMTFQGLDDADQRKDVVAFLKGLGGE
jgi:cytochrome c